MFDPFLFEQYFAPVGMMEAATITSGGVVYPCFVGYYEPGVPIMNSAVLSTEYEIELINPTVAPNLAEGDQVVVKGNTFRVREKPGPDYDPRHGIDGSYRRARLTKI
jgi:hypothetical protein